MSYLVGDLRLISVVESSCCYHFDEKQHSRNFAFFQLAFSSQIINLSQTPF